MSKNGNIIQQILSEGTPFLVKELKHIRLGDKTVQMDGGGILLCTNGKATLMIDTALYEIKEGSEAILLDNVSLFIKERSEDFEMTMLIYSKEVAYQATHKFSPIFFAYIYEHPIYQHEQDSHESTLSYFKILSDIQNDETNRYRILIGINILRSMMLNMYDKIQRVTDTKRNPSESRSEELFNRFMDLIIKYGRTHRDVGFYAKKLCISPRYLGSVTRKIAGESPKQTIDNYLISEIKLILTFSDMTIQQIADYLHFPDQSYLGRYFKHQTGMSPLTYRQNEMVI